MRANPRTPVAAALSLVAAALVAACGGKGAEADKPDAATISDGPPNCQRLSASYLACIAAMPEAGRAGARDGLKAMQDAWKGVEKDKMDAVCQQALDAARQGLATACPGVKWR